MWKKQQQHIDTKYLFLEWSNFFSKLQIPQILSILGIYSLKNVFMYELISDRHNSIQKVEKSTSFPAASM